MIPFRFKKPADAFDGVEGAKHRVQGLLVLRGVFQDQGVNLYGLQMLQRLGHESCQEFLVLRAESLCRRHGRGRLFFGRRRGCFIRRRGRFCRLPGLRILPGLPGSLFRFILEQDGLGGAGGSGRGLLGRRDTDFRHETRDLFAACLVPQDRLGQAHAPIQKIHTHFLIGELAQDHLFQMLLKGFRQKGQQIMGTAFANNFQLFQTG